MLAEKHPPASSELDAFEQDVIHGLSQQQKKIILLGHGPRYLAKKRKLFLLTLKKFTNT